MSNAPCIRCGYGFGESDSCRIHNEAEARIEAERDAALARVKELQDFANTTGRMYGLANARIAELEGALRNLLSWFPHGSGGTYITELAQARAVLEGKK